MGSHISIRNAIFVFMCLIGVGIVYTPLTQVFHQGARSEYYSHIMLIPLVTGYLIYTRRKRVFIDITYSYNPGLLVVLCGFLSFAFGRYFHDRVDLNDYTSLIVLSAVLFWIGGFLFCYGLQAFRSARFPLLFMVFVIPIPSVVMDNVIYILQVGSTEVTNFLFAIIGIPYTRDGFIFQFSAINIEVAKECSGIRSSIALFITGILGGHYFLKSGWRKSVLLLAMVPITIVKNGIRIVTICLLAIYVDPKFLTDSWLHHSGGFVFYIPALALMGGILWHFRKAERKAFGANG